MNIRIVALAALALFGTTTVALAARGKQPTGPVGHPWPAGVKIPYRAQMWLATPNGSCAQRQAGAARLSAGTNC